MLDININELVSTYQNGIDTLLDPNNGVSKKVTLVFKEKVENVESDFRDGVRPNSLKKPSWKDGTSSGPQITEHKSNIYALIQHNPRDFNKYNINIKKPEETVRLKTYLSDIPDLQRCDHIIPDADNTGILYKKFTLVQQPIPIGLKESRYAISFWEHTGA